MNCGNTNDMNMWPSQLNRNLNNCEVASRQVKAFRALTGFEPLPLRLPCNAEDPYTESMPIYCVHQPVKGMKHKIK